MDYPFVVILCICPALAASGVVCYNARRFQFNENKMGRNCMTSRRSALGLIGVGLPALIVSRASAAALDYPTRPVRFVVGYPPGGATDILARLIGQRLSEKLGQQFVVENKPGAGNNIGAPRPWSTPSPMATPCCSSTRPTTSTPRSTPI
jgi:tripartite-type tricarboxylate transporter receptor subunit TctC